MVLFAAWGSVCPLGSRIPSPAMFSRLRPAASRAWWLLLIRNCCRLPAGLLAFFIALFASLALTIPVRALAIRVGMVDLPGPRKLHLQPIPLLGGLAMYAAVVLAVLFSFSGPARSQIM